MSFGNPELLWLAGAAPLALLLLFWHDHATRRRLVRRLGDLPVLGKLMATVSPRRRVLKLVLVQLACALILIAAARPQIAGRRAVEIRGLDLVVAMDVSASMLVDDVGSTQGTAVHQVPASRLARARDLAVAMIDELPDDRFGPVVFAGAASHFPVTDDDEVAIRFLHDLGPADLPPGSNLTEVFRVSRCLLRPDLYDDLGCARVGRRGRGGDPLPGESLDPAELPDEEDAIEETVERGKAMVVFTDGGDVDEQTLREAATMRELGIAVVVVGVGTPRGGVVHDVDPEGRPTSTAKRAADGSPATSRRDDAGLRLVAEAAGDPRRYLIASERGEVDPTPIVDALRAVNRGLATRKVAEPEDVYKPFVFAAFMLLVIEAVVATRRRRRYPERT